jgi:elongation factor G
VLKVRLETESSEHQKELLRALERLSIEDPSLVVEETESATLLSGLGELHIEVTIDRLFREFGISAREGKPSVSYRETITDPLKSIGLVNYDRTVGGTRLQAAVALALSPSRNPACDNADSSCMLLTEPIVTVSQEVRAFLRLDPDTPDDDLMVKSEVFKAIVQGCQGALKRGPLGPHCMANLNCHVTAVDSEEGLGGLLALPGALRAAAAHAVTSTLLDNKDFCKVLEPTMSLEVTLPNDMVGSVLSDLTGGRRGNIGEVMVGESMGGIMSKALIRGDVPLVEILGYAKSLRSLTGGEGSFSAEYKGHSPCDG